MKRLIIIGVAITFLTLPSVGFAEESIKVVGVNFGTTQKDIIEQYKKEGIEPISKERTKDGDLPNVEEFTKGIIGEVLLSDSIHKMIEESVKISFGKVTALYFQKSIVDISGVKMVSYQFFDNQLFSINIEFHVSTQRKFSEIKSLYMDLLKRKYGDPVNKLDGILLFWYVWPGELYSIVLKGHNWERWHQEVDIPYTGLALELGNDLTLYYSSTLIGTPWCVFR